MTRIELPPAFVALAAQGSDWSAYVERTPRLVADLLEEWSLRLDGAAMHGQCALVLPVLTADGTPAALKVGYPHDEAEHEALALQQWAGHGAVRLLRADPHRFALLLERLHPQDLTEVWDLEACEIVAGLYAGIHVPASARLRRLSVQTAAWAERLGRLPTSVPLPRRLVDQGVSLARDLALDPATDGTTIHTDLHYENVLAADRAPWLVIDPKPLSGDPHHEVAPLLWNRWDDVLAGGDVRDGVRRRFLTVVDTAGLDEDRARDWVIVRMLLNAVAEIEGSPGAFPDEWVTRCISIAKAVQE